MSEQLEQLYQEARSALKEKNYIRAGGLLRQILQIDENYKDASRLLALLVRLRRRRWYNHPIFWSVLGVATVIALGIWLAPKISLPADELPAPTIRPTETSAPLQHPDPTVTFIPTKTPRPAPTIVPLAWKRVNTGQFITRDTVTTIAIDPKDPDVLYVGTQNAGIYKSIDGGLSWQPSFNGLRDVHVHSIVIDPANTNIIYVGLEMDRVYKSTDGGRNWEPAGSGLTASGDGHQRLLMSPGGSSTLYYVAAPGISKTTDGGASWSKINFPCGEGISDMVIDPSTPSVLFATYYGEEGCAPSLYISRDGGETWELLREFGPEARPHYEGGLSIDFRGMDIYSIHSNKGPTVFSSTNIGLDWRSASIHCHVVEPHPSEKDKAYCGTTDSGIYITTNGGSNWTFLASPQIGPIKSIAFLPNDPSRMFAGGNGLVYSPDGGKNWEDRSNGLGSVLFEIKIHPDTHDFFARQWTWNKVIYQSEDDGTNWDLIKKDCRIDFAPEGKVHCWGWVPRNVSLDNGRTWQDQMVKGPTGTGDAYANPYKPNEIFSLAHWDSGISYSNTEGKFWKTVDENPAHLVNAAFFFAPDQQSIYVIGTQIYRSLDGTVWSQCNFLDGKISETETRAAINPHDSLNIYVATRGSGIAMSKNGCESWRLKRDLGSRFVNTIAIDPKHPDTIYAGTDGGAYVSFNGGQTWGQINDGLLGATVVYSIVVDKDSNVYAATPYGIFKLEGK